MTTSDVDRQRRREAKDHVAEAVDLVHDHPGVEHIWLNAFRCVNPTDEYAATIGRLIIRRVMAQHHDDVFKRRHIVLRINAS